MTTKSETDRGSRTAGAMLDREGAMVGTLNRLVALSSDLRSQLKQAHWNTVGPNFIALHHLFDEQAAIVLAHVDLYAERVRALQGVAKGTVRAAAAESPLEEIGRGELWWHDAVTSLLERFEQYSRTLTDGIREADEAEDLTTQDLLIEAQREVDLQAYFLRSHLGESSSTR
ncbi:MAG: DNA starvation/stationary phase protection protein Dps [Dehalococcoidia bacterium]|nr:DNA starvation/stationary phase protection protein Dps [Dehalococcoidia bacterium]